jgi:kynurenine formamidase
MKYIDLTHDFKRKMPAFPGDPVPEFSQIATLKKDSVLSFQIKTGMHIGTHMDAPSHMLKGGKYLNEFPVDKFFGRGMALDARGMDIAERGLLSGVKLKKNDIVLICFGWSEKFHKKQYYEEYPVLSEDFADMLVKSGITIVGMDTPSPDRLPYKVHKILLAHNILIIENLTNLQALVGEDDFEVIALPVRFQAEAAPCRVVAILK